MSHREDPAIHRVAVLAMHGVVPLDLAIPCEVFDRVELPHRAKAYAVQVCSETPEISSSSFSIRTTGTLDDLTQADTVIIPGIANPATPVPDAIVVAIRTAYANGARVVSICSGALILAATGLLDGRRATTHWLVAELLARLHPLVRVDPNVLFVDEGRIVTSAGASAGLDMCFHLLRCDHGQAVAAQAARAAVAPLDREGGQAQFIVHQEPQSSASLAPVLEWMRENAHHRLSVNDLARQAKTSPRTFARRFREQVGTTPLQWLLTARVRHARELLETTTLSLDEVANLVGFDSISTLRKRFQQAIGVNPKTYRLSMGLPFGEA